MSATEATSASPDFPSDRVNRVSTSIQTGAPSGPRRRPTPLATFRSMPVIIKIAAVWLIFIFGLALYAKADTALFDGSLPLKDPNFQTNNFNPSAGEFGTGEANAPLSGDYWLGTDTLARDTFARIAHGAWVSLIVAVVSVLFGVIVGGFLGSLVGFVRGRTETFVMALIDVILAFPALILLLAIVSIFEVRDLVVISGVVGVLSIPSYTRVARANSLAVSTREFVTAARAIGTKSRVILFREVIPNVLPTLLSYAMVVSAFVIVVEGSLSFLGLSVQLPTSSWGNMINQARGDMKEDFIQVLLPSLALSFTVLSLNQVGDWFQKRGSVKGSLL